MQKFPYENVNNNITKKPQRRREQKQKDYLAVPGPFHNKTSRLDPLSPLTIQTWVMEEEGEEGEETRVGKRMVWMGRGV